MAVLLLFAPRAAAAPYSDLAPSWKVALTYKDGPREPVEAPKRPPVSIEELILDTFPDEPIMLAVARSESRLNPLAKNPRSTAKGIFQILDGTWEDCGCSGNPYVASDNIKCARKVYEKQGLAAWDDSRAMWE